MIFQAIRGRKKPSDSAGPDLLTVGKALAQASDAGTGVAGSRTNTNQLPDTDGTQDDSHNIPRYRRLYFTNSLVRAGVDNIASHAVLTGPRVRTSPPDVGKDFMLASFMAYKPHVGFVDWLVDIATWYIVDGEIFLKPVSVGTVGGDKAITFKAMDPCKVQADIRGMELTGWRYTGTIEATYTLEEVLHLFDVKNPDQMRGISALRSAVKPAGELYDAQTAMDAAFTEYGKLPGYWEVPEYAWQQLEGPVDGESEEDEKAREARNVAKMNTLLSLTAGTVPKVRPGTVYHPINRSADAFMRNYPEYWRSKTMEIARALDIPDYVVSGSVRDTNYSALRIAFQDAQIRYQGIQRFLETVLRWCFNQWVVNGRAVIDEIAWPPQHPLDVLKEFHAYASGTQARLVSPQSAMKALGYSYDEELAKWEQWQKDIEQRGIPLPRPVYPPTPEGDE